MQKPALISVFLTFVACSALLGGQTAPPTPEELFVRDALPVLLGRADFPDRGLAGGVNATRYTILADVDRTTVKLTAAALPTIPGVELTLISLDEARELAARTNQRVSFIRMAGLRIGPNEATVAIGPFFVLPPDLNQGVVMACCCVSTARFMRNGTGWVFQGWMYRVCA